MAFIRSTRIGGERKPLNPYAEIGAKLPSLTDVTLLCKQPPFQLTNFKYDHRSQIIRKLLQVSDLGGVSPFVVELVLSEYGLAVLIVLSQALITDTDTLKTCANEAIMGLREVCGIDPEVAEQFVTFSLEKRLDQHYEALASASETLAASVHLQGQIVKSVDLLVKGNQKLSRDMTTQDLVQAIKVAEAATRAGLTRHQANLSSLLPMAPPTKLSDLETDQDMCTKISFGGDVDPIGDGDSDHFQHSEGSGGSKSESVHDGPQKRDEFNKSFEESMAEQQAMFDSTTTATRIEHEVLESLRKGDNKLMSMGWDNVLSSLRDGKMPQMEQDRKLSLCLDYFGEATSLVVQMLQLLLTKSGVLMDHCSKPVEVFLIQQHLERNKACEQSATEKKLGCTNLARQVYKIINQNLNPTKTEEEIKQSIKEKLCVGEGPPKPFDEATFFSFGHVAFNKFKEKAEDYDNLAASNEKLTCSQYQMFCVRYLGQLQNYPSDACKKAFMKEIKHWQSLNDFNKDAERDVFVAKGLQIWSQLEVPASFHQKPRSPRDSSGGASSGGAYDGSQSGDGHGKKKGSPRPRGASKGPKPKTGDVSRQRINSTFRCMNCGKTHGAGTSHPYKGCPDKWRASHDKWCNAHPAEWAKEKEKARNDPAHPYHHVHAKSESSDGASSGGAFAFTALDAAQEGKPEALMLNFHDVMAVLDSRKASEPEDPAKERIAQQMAALQTLAGRPASN